MTTVPEGISGQVLDRPHDHDGNWTNERLGNELALMQLGDVVPLEYKIDVPQFKQEIQQFSNDWVDYLPRPDRPNNRKALSVTTLPEWDHKGAPSLAEATKQLGRKVLEEEFSKPTDVYNNCRSLHYALSPWMPLARTFLVQANIGGYFVPHRDYPIMNRRYFRLIAFLNNCGPLDYDWILDDKKVQIEHGRLYYLNTRKMHRTISWVNNSIHLILNVPFTTENVAKVVARLQHRH